MVISGDCGVGLRIVVSVVRVVVVVGGWHKKSTTELIHAPLRLRIAHHECNEG